MDVVLVIGFILGLATLLLGTIFNGVALGMLVNPAAMFIVFLGIIAVMVSSYSTKELARLPKIFGVLFRKEEEKPEAVVGQIVELANMARREGLLSLENSVQNLENPFLKKGMEMVVDGVNPEQIQEILENEISSLEDRHLSANKMFKTAGATAPTLGVLGSCTGMIAALGNLEAVGELGGLISSSFVSTVYGIAVGYLIMIPISTRLAAKSEIEVQEMYMVIEGVVGIQSGLSPKTIEQKLFSLIEPDKRPANEA